MHSMTKVANKQIALYSIMLEGRFGGKGFLVSMDVTSESAEIAERIALQEAKLKGWDIVGIEETMKKESKRVINAQPGVQRIYGRAFFDLGA